MHSSTTHDADVYPKPNVEASSDDEVQPPTKQQKLIKAGLLLALVLVIVYVVLDYTVSEDGIACAACSPADYVDLLLFRKNVEDSCFLKDICIARTHARRRLSKATLPAG